MTVGELNEALSQLTKKFGVNFEIGTIRFDNSSFSCKLKGDLKSKTSNSLNFAPSGPKVPTNHNLKVGDIFKVKRTCYKIESIFGKGKFPISVITDSGKMYKVSPSYLLDGGKLGPLGNAFFKK